MDVKSSFVGYQWLAAKPVFIYSIFTLFLVPNWVAVLAPFEEWPFTPAPMFAHFVGSDTPRYKFIFEAKLEEGATKELGYYSVGANWSLMRFFFKYVYGSAEVGSPFAVYQEDSSKEFQIRLTRFFSAFKREYEKRNHGQRISEITLLVAPLKSNSNEELGRRVVGVFKEEAFIHSWRAND